MRKPSLYTTPQVARMVGVNRVTLERWISTGKVQEPKTLSSSLTMSVRFWTLRDVERVRKYKEKFYRKGRGPKAKAKP